MEDNLPCTSSRARPNHCHGKQIFKTSKLGFQLSDLPEDMLCKILSELPLKEVIRTSVLSSKWRHVRTINPKLRFDGMTMRSHRSVYGSNQCTQEFIQNVNAALKQHNGMFVEDFELNLGFTIPTMLENTSKFSQLRYLVLELTLNYIDSGNILSLASYLKAAPLVEKFELHFNDFICPHLDWEGEPLRSLPQCPHIYLKDLYITGFSACTGQLEILLRTLENAPGLEVVTLDPALRSGKNIDALLSQIAHEISRRHLRGRISPSTKLCIL
ncbi:hypothetical protein C2845_PM09G05790 [Panicum miliaceum]|uniref:F-box domain-containing protein n=1 Tax=Panicum miliaceum TaxID=4540 RepID=A0A3L6RY59_PANMI|nr:hypothetical protein C2845_PM09G05790 [Panicum miliaceum]